MGKSTDIRLKRAYEAPAPTDGRRFLVDRLWPRGVARDALAVEAWLTDVAPSAPLRRRYGHRPQGWRDFAAAYRAELDEKPEALAPLLEAMKGGPVTLVYAARDTERNNAVVLKAYLEGRAT